VTETKAACLLASGRDEGDDARGYRGDRHSLKRDLARALYDSVEEAFAAEEDVLRALDLNDLHAAGCAHIGKVACIGNDLLFGLELILYA